MYNISEKGNYLQIIAPDGTSYIGAKTDVKVIPNANNTLFSITGLCLQADGYTKANNQLLNIPLTDLADANNVAFTLQTWEAFYTTKTAFNPANEASGNGSASFANITGNATDNVSLSNSLAGKANLSAGKHLASESRASNVTYNVANGIITFTWADGSSQAIDLPVENLLQNANYNSSTKTLTLTTSGGGNVDIPLTDLVDLPEVILSTSAPVSTPTTGQKLYIKTDSGELWSNVAGAWVKISNGNASFLNITGSPLDNPALASLLNSKLEFGKTNLYWVLVDFLTTNANQNAPFGGSAIAGGTSGNSTAFLNKARGITNLLSSATANSGYAWTTSAACLLLRGGEISYSRLLWTGTADRRTRAGFLDTSTIAEVVDGAYFNIDASGSITAVNVSNNIATTSAVLLTIDAAKLSKFYDLWVTIKADLSGAMYTITDENNAVVATTEVLGNIPSTSGRFTGAGVVGINANTTTGVEIVLVDKLGLGLGLVS